MTARRVHVVCRPEVAAGFGLAGFQPINAASAADAGDRVRELLQQPDAGVVLIEQELYQGLPEDVRRRAARRPLPMIVPFGGPSWTVGREDAEAYIVELLRQVIGYRVRLR